MDENITNKVESMRAKVDELKNEYERLNQLANDKWVEAQELESQACELIVPFKRGQVISYPNKSYTGRVSMLKMEIKRMRFYVTGIELSGIHPKTRNQAPTYIIMNLDDVKLVTVIK